MARTIDEVVEDIAVNSYRAGATYEKLQRMTKKYQAIHDEAGELAEELHRMTCPDCSQAAVN